ncbi:hypothetical protein E4U26_004968 [Claviceps purpurea]|nr:hypothetical protein E4U26_004968 [Claviceps purpurea]
MQQEQALGPETPAVSDANCTRDDQKHIPQQEEASSENPQRQSPLPSSPPAPTPKAVTLCGVCGAEQPKYKCPRCYVPYCSVACNKTHKENHPPDQPIPVPQPDKPVPSSNGTSNSPQKNGSLNPFRVLDTSDDLRRLFRKYPNLAEQLLTIFAATQPPEEAPDKRIPASLMQGVAKKETWNHDIGINNGKEALRKARDLKGEAGEAVREYSELVLHLMNTGDDKGQASTVLQRQVAQEDSKLIEQLMAQERG